jgi:hypothetical protein
MDKEMIIKDIRENVTLVVCREKKTDKILMQIKL